MKGDEGLKHVRLDTIQVRRESKSYIDCLHAILLDAGLFHGPKHELAGLTGMAFKFSVHEQLLPMSVTAYGYWGDAHKPGIDNLGLFTIMDGGSIRHPSFPHYQQEAIRGIIEHLDKGFGAIYWLPEFAVLTGYDEEERVFFIQDGSGKEQIVLFDNVGINFTEFWCCQIFGQRTTVSQPEMVLESLRLAIEDWDTPYRTLPNRTVASGKMAFNYFVRALEGGNYHGDGAVYILDSYRQSRHEIRTYLHGAMALLPGLDDAAAPYRQLAPILDGIVDCITIQEGKRVIEQRQHRSLIRLLHEAQRLEEFSVAQFRTISQAYPDLRRTTIPRWGTHTPK